MKKQLLFVIDSLHCAGAEKSLVSLLSLLDYSDYCVDLMLFGHGGVLEELVPKEVNILKPLKFTEFATYNLITALNYSILNLDFKMFTSRMKYTIGIRKKKYSNPQIARIFWQSVSNVIEENPKQYDVAISYAQGVPTFYVAEKVNAKKKYAWVNANLELNEKEIKFQKTFYDCYNKIIAVSDFTEDVLKKLFPYYADKIKVIYDINNPNIISEMANSGVGFKDTFDGIRILTIGRFDPLKGYDIALAACKLLKEKGIKFKWYALGKGPLQREIEDYIRENKLTDDFILLGVNANPYQFLKKSDIYVQTSRTEGFGLAIAEARMLNIPIVTTKFDSVNNQMIQERNGLIVDMNADAVCQGIFRLLNDRELKNNIINYLHTEKKGNIEEIKKFYSLIR